MSKTTASNDPLAKLDEKIQALKDEEELKHHSDESYSQAHVAWRMVIELVAGILIGFGIGYGLDSLFGTMPIFLILFILLGFAAGIRVMLRTSQEIAERSLADKAGGKEGH